MIKKFSMTAQLFAGMFTEGHHPAYRIVKDAMPSDIRVEDVRIRFSELDGQIIEFLLASDHFAVGTDDWLTPVAESVTEKEIR